MKLLPAATLLILLASALPAQAGSLSSHTKGQLAPSDIAGALILGKNGELITLDSSGKTTGGCVIGGNKAHSLPPCPEQQEGAQTRQSTRETGVPCTGYTYVVINGVWVKVWTPAGCTPP
ncbi:hypothetical protein [Zoogloea sp.]|uniref:hypothetical protein n=1 Tax=Zoogloea sp. TaxID=49181 RepID=UPI00260750C7|nr:hypothetical protein [Zoogloea sp.]MDD3353088.1 hypothetical protein [Zoogloea sp.]